MIYVMFPTEAEMAPLTDMLEGRLKVETCKRAGAAGLLGGRPVTLLASGVGQVNTAQTVTALLEGGRAEFVLMGGCAGAYVGSGLKVGDVAVAMEEIYADTGVLTTDGWLDMEDICLPLAGPGVGGNSRFNRFPLQLEHFKEGMDNASRAVPKPAVSGAFLTVSTVSGTSARGTELYGRYGAICENMEGAAAAHVCFIYGVPFLEVRGISNMVVDRDREGWDINAATVNCALFIYHFLKAGVI